MEEPWGVLLDMVADLKRSFHMLETHTRHPSECNWQRECYDAWCKECHWDLIGEAKAFRGDLFDEFWSYLSKQKIWRAVLWEDGNVYIHRELPIEALGDWTAHLYYTDIVRLRREEANEQEKEVRE